MKKKRSSPWRRLAYASGALSLLVILASFFVSKYYLTFSRHQPYDQLPSDLQLPFTEVDFPSRMDRVKIHGWFIPGAQQAAGSSKNQGTILIVHGHHSNMGKIGKINLLSNIAMPLHRQGYGVLLFDLRNHGQSGDLPPVTLGFWEKDDVLGAIDFLDQQSSAWGIDSHRLGIFGVSMGGATSIYAAAADLQGKSPHIKAAFIESAFARTRDPIELKLGIDGVPHLVQKLLLFWFSILPEQDILQNNPIEYIKDLAIPLYFVHAHQDREVRPEDAEEMYERARHEHPGIPAELWISPASEHAATAGELPVEFTERLVGFFSKVL